jgi:Asp-tRNA(Asn)/Glu-tRNA(Gln) amidotransferase A subunit family amidase
VTHPQDLSLREQAAMIADGSLNPAELLDATLTRIEERNGTLRAVAATFPQESRRMLERAPPGPLHGVPVSVKDMFSLPWRGYHNGTSHELGERVASGPFRRLRDAGAVIVAVDNQHELGMGTTGCFSVHGAAGNPWNPAHCAGGSSGGSAAAVSARLVAGALGSDSGGSTRLPAGWCGVLGLKVTYGSVPYDGYTGANSTLSAPGVFARDSEDARLLLGALQGRVLPAGAGAALRVGVVSDPYWQDIDAEVVVACREALQSAEFPLVDEQIELAALGGPAGAIRAGSELGSAVPAAVIAELHPVTRGLLNYMAIQPAQRLIRADRVRARLRAEVSRALGSCDVLAWPTNPAPSPPIETPILQLPSGPASADGANIRQATLANLAGVPGISVPVGFHSSGLPIGLQLLAGWGQEELLLDAASRIEQATARRWVDARPEPARG